MYISRVKLDTKLDSAKRAIASPQVLHAMLANCFKEKNRILWRLDNLLGSMCVLMVSEIPPDFSTLEPQVCGHGVQGETKDYSKFLSCIENGSKLQFRFRGNPVRNIPIKDGKRGRVSPHIGEKHKRQWLLNVAGKNGFLLDDAQFQIVETGMRRFYKAGNEQAVRISGTTYEGVLTVADSELFKDALCKGIGRAKAYGCGLMTVMHNG